MTADDEKRWVLCPAFGSKTRIQVFRETEIKNFPLFCPKCRRESMIDIKNYITRTNKPDAKTQR